MPGSVFRSLVGREVALAAADGIEPMRLAKEKLQRETQWCIVDAERDNRALLCATTFYLTGNVRRRNGVLHDTRASHRSHAYQCAAGGRIRDKGWGGFQVHAERGQVVRVPQLDLLAPQLIHLRERYNLSPCGATENPVQSHGAGLVRNAGRPRHWQPHTNDVAPAIGVRLGQFARNPS